MHFRYFLAVFELLSDSLTATYVELHRCPSHHSILLTQGPISEIFAKKFWELAILKNELFLSRPFWIFFSKKKKKICFIPMKISLNLYGRMDGSKFWRFPWFLENSLVCVILRYTVYVFLDRFRSVTGFSQATADTSRDLALETLVFLPQERNFVQLCVEPC